MTYSLFIDRFAQKQLAKIPQPHQERLITAIRALADNPQPAETIKLSAREAWRLRVGDYRIIYEIHEVNHIIQVVAIGHRSTIYRR